MATRFVTENVLQELRRAHGDLVAEQPGSVGGLGGGLEVDRSG